MIIGVTGFSWSGSSAVKEFIREFDDVQCYNQEFLIAYHPDGIADLDYHLNTNVAKFMSSGVAIPRFRKIAKTLLKDETHGRIDDLVEEYISSLVQVKWVGSESGQIVLSSNQWFYQNVAARFMRKVYFHIPFRYIEKFKPYPVGIKELSICPDNFIEKTRHFTDSILVAMGFDLNKPILLDQPFPGNSPSRSMRYYRDSKAIIVDRDPRDIYLFVHERFPNEAYSVPHTSVESFIAYYRELHKTIPMQKQADILYVKFEDMIYKYKETGETIKSFLGLEKSNEKIKYFDPNMSKANTRLFEKGTKYQNEIKKIEEALPEYLYDFSNYPLDLSGEIFNINPLTKSH